MKRSIVTIAISALSGLALLPTGGEGFEVETHAAISVRAIGSSGCIKLQVVA